MKYDIVIVDSGINLKYQKYLNQSFDGICLSKNGDEFIIKEDIQDQYGHGTAIYTIIKHNCSAESIFIIKLDGIVEENYEIEQELFIFALNYIYQKIDCNIVNLSLGLKTCNDIMQLKEICGKLCSKGTIILSAFDNGGAMSYPACLEDVIGVDSGKSCYKANEFEYVENSPLNLRAYGGKQRLFWSNPDYFLMSGNSFACAYVTAYAYEIIKNKQTNREELINEFKIKSIYIHRSYNNSLSEKDLFDTAGITNAIIFPFNKEMHSLIRFKSLLDFKIVDVYDIGYSGKVGVKVSKILEISELIEDYIIKNISDVSWDGVDTLILGHMDQISRLVGNSNFVFNLINSAINNNINIFSFEPLDYLEGFKNINKFNSKVFWSEINWKNLPENWFGKLYQIKTPVLGVYGTSSKQGKFSLQLTIRDLLQKKGYRVGQLGTEPTALLFNMDEVYPMGYNSAVKIKEHDSIIYLNQAMHNISMKDNDIILVGSQANTIPYEISNLNGFPCRQINFLFGTQPDAVILCINSYDQISYIERTIKFIEASVDCKVIALCMFPMDIKDDWTGIYGAKELIDEDKYVRMKESLNEKFGILVCKLGIQNDMNELIEGIINFFTY